jgi:glycosyltransferase involved in cell wall biosynthesis
MNLHLMHLIEALRVGGAQRVLVDLANATAADGQRVSVCLLDDRGALAAQLRPDIPVHVLGRRNGLDWQTLRRLAVLMRQQQVNLLHVHSRRSFLVAALARALARLQLPILLHDHHGAIEIDPTVPLWFRLWGCRRVDRYVGVSARLADWAVAAGVPRDKTCVVPDALDLGRIQAAPPADLRAEFGIEPGERVGLVVCGLRREKGLLQLLEALSRVVARHRVKVLVVGGEREPGHLAECKTRAFVLALGDRVIFAGERIEVPSFAKGADFGVIPSISEAGPLVLIEFLAAGLPCVATRVGEIAHQVEKLGGAQFVPPNDPVALAAALEQLLELPPEDWDSRRQAAQRIATEYFDVHAALPRWYSLYREALKAATA